MKTFTFFPLCLIFLVIINASSVLAQWSYQTNPLGKGEAAMIGKIQFISSSEGWISAENGSLLHTTNGGATWSTVKPSSSEVVYFMSDVAFNMQFLNSTTGWVMGTLGKDLDHANGAVIYYTTNGGSSWSKSVLAQGEGIIGAQVQFLDASNGFATLANTKTDKGYLYKTTNGGVDWSLVSTLTSSSFDEAYWFYFISKTTGWSLMINDSPALIKISKTTDGGVTWTDQYKDATSRGADTLTSSGAIQFIDANNGWVVGPNSRILKTTDGGATWTSISNAGIGSHAYNKCLFALNANNVWIGSSVPDTNPSSHPVIHTTDGGATWTKESINLEHTSFSIFFLDANNGWLTSDLGVIASYKSQKTEAEVIDGDQTRITTLNGSIVISNGKIGDVAKIYSITGSLIKAVSIASNRVVISGILSGFYVVRIGNSGVKITL